MEEADRPPGTSKTIQSVHTALAIVEELRRREGAGITELAEALGVANATVHHHLATLHEEGYVARSGENYRLGRQFLRMGGHVQEREALYEIGKNPVDDLARKVGETVQLVVEERGRGIYLYQSFGEPPRQDPSGPGTLVDLHCASGGKAILAQVPEEQVTAIVDRHGLARGTEHSIADRGTLFDRLEEIRDRGVAFDDEEQFVGIRGVGSAITTEGGPIGAVSIIGPIDRIDDDRFYEELPGVVENAAGVIEFNATYSPWIS